MQTQHKQIESMGTRLDIVFPGIDVTRCNEIVSQVMAELDRIEGKLSVFQTGSELSIINKTAHAGLVELDSELLLIFQDIIQYHRMTEGYFDVTMMPVFNFHRTGEDYNKPVPDEIRKLAGLDNLEILQHGIKFREKGIQVDLGGYGKGYAVKKVVQILESCGIECALLSFGDSLVYGLGTHPYGDSWIITVPVDDISAPVAFKLKNEALSTSGNTLNNQKKFGNSGHIVNPVTLSMRRANGLISVKSTDPVRAEVFSTALFSAGEDRSNEILKLNLDLEVKWLLNSE